MTAATVIVGAVVLVLFGAAIFYIIKNRGKGGCTGCSGDCSNCHKNK